MPTTVRTAVDVVLQESDARARQARAVYVERPATIPSTVCWRGHAPVARPVLPDGCSDLIWTGEGLLVAGPDTVPHVSPTFPGRMLTALRFGPGVGPAVFGVPMAELRDHRVDFEQVAAGPLARRLVDRLAASGDPGAVLEEEVRLTKLLAS